MLKRRTEEESPFHLEVLPGERTAGAGRQGPTVPDIDSARREAAASLREYVSAFLSGQTDVDTFKTLVDSFNKRNNYWGFTAIKGQMFFNQLANSAGESRDDLARVLRSCLGGSEGIEDALGKIDFLEKHCRKFFDPAPDKRRAPNPGSVPYFLSYFWQLSDPERWPILYTSLVESFQALGAWKDFPSQRQTYEYFYSLNLEIKDLLSVVETSKIGFWDIEHAFWNFRGNPSKPKASDKQKNREPESAPEPRPEASAQDSAVAVRRGSSIT